MCIECILKICKHACPSPTTKAINFIHLVDFSLIPLFNTSFQSSLQSFSCTTNNKYTIHSVIYFINVWEWKKKKRLQEQKRRKWERKALNVIFHYLFAFASLSLFYFDVHVEVGQEYTALRNYFVMFQERNLSSRYLFLFFIFFFTYSLIMSF